MYTEKGRLCGLFLYNNLLYHNHSSLSLQISTAFLSAVLHCDVRG